MKSKLFFILWVIFSIAFTACATTGGSSAASTTAEETIVCLGDSLSSGYSATIVGKDDKSKAWPAFLQNKVNIPVINASVGGNTTAQGLARVKKDVLSKNPRIVIIYLGGNDVIQRLPLASVKNNLQKIIDMVNDGRRKIYITTFYSLDWPGGNEVKDMYYTIASSNNQIELIDFNYLGEISAKKELMADELHPNAKGCEIMAGFFFEALKPYLAANNLIKE